ARVDDARIDAPDVVEVDAQPPARGGEEVGEEDVRGPDQAMEELEAAGVRQIDSDAPLAAVRLLDHEVDAAGRRDEPGRHEPALLGARAGLPDLDDVGPPCGEHRACRRHEPPLRDLDHPDAVENTIHRWSSSAAR